MSSALDKFLDLLNLERIEKGLFRGKCEQLGLPQVYGGQVIGQALSAATQTVPLDLRVHSYHSNFLLPGDVSKPIIYDVEILRDGKSFATRRVKAIQNGVPIFYLSASFQIDESGMEHQSIMPQWVGSPGNLASEQEIAKEFATSLPKQIQPLFLGEKAIEFRPVIALNPLEPKKRAPTQALWMKTNGKLPHNLRIHQYLLAYASDWGFLPVSMYPHEVGLLTAGMKIATVDHSMWFHRPFRFDDWLVHVIESPSASGARGFVRGEIFNQKGELIASTAQDGLIRYRP